MGASQGLETPPGSPTPRGALTLPLPRCTGSSDTWAEHPGRRGGWRGGSGRTSRAVPKSETGSPFFTLNQANWGKVTSAAGEGAEGPACLSPPSRGSSEDNPGFAAPAISPPISADAPLGLGSPIPWGSISSPMALFVLQVLPTPAGPESSAASLVVGPTWCQANSGRALCPPHPDMC